MPRDPFAEFRPRRRFDRAFRTMLLTATVALIGVVAGGASVFAVVGALMASPHADQSGAMRTNSRLNPTPVTAAPQATAPATAAAAADPITPAPAQNLPPTQPPPASSALNAAPVQAPIASPGPTGVPTSWSDARCRAALACGQHKLAVENAQAARAKVRPAKPLYGYVARSYDDQQSGRVTARIRRAESNEKTAISDRRPTSDSSRMWPRAGFDADEKSAESRFGYDGWGDWHR